MGNYVDPSRVESLLDDLCIRLGFCLPPDARSRLLETPPADAAAFTDAVFIAEGMNPALVDRHLYRQVRAMVVRAFSEAQEA